MAKCPPKNPEVSSCRGKEEKAIEGWGHGHWLKLLPQVESAFEEKNVQSCCLFAEDTPVQSQEDP